MGLLSGLLGSSNKSQSSSSSSTDAATNVGGDANAPVLTLANSSGSTVNMLDGGAIGQAFDFASLAGERNNALVDSILSTSSTLQREASNRAFDFVSQNLKPDAEVQRDQFVYLGFGLLAVVAVIFIWGRK